MLNLNQKEKGMWKQTKGMAGSYTLDQATMLTDLIFFANSYDLWKFAKLPFHAVYPLNNNHYLLPRPMGSWLSFCNLFP